MGAGKLLDQITVVAFCSSTGVSNRKVSRTYGSRKPWLMLIFVLHGCNLQSMHDSCSGHIIIVDLVLICSLGTMRPNFPVGEHDLRGGITK